MWKQVFKFIYKTTVDTFMKYFYFEIILIILPTRKMFTFFLSQQYIVTSIVMLSHFSLLENVY